jgi:hypothetical protein
MARPSARVIKTIVTATGTQLDLLEAEDCYVIVYKRKPVNIRHLSAGLGKDRRKYMKLSFTNEGNAHAQVRRLNKLFDCEDFAFVRGTV